MSDYKTEIDDMRWSYSRLSSFEHCKYEFYLNYIIHDNDLYLSESNFYAECGSFVHEILAKVLTGEIKAEDALQYYLDNFDDNVCYRTSPKIVKKKFEACADYFAMIDDDMLKDYEILGVEMENTFKIEGYNFVGFIDLLLRNKSTKEIVLVDHKSAAYPAGKRGGILKNQQRSFESYKRQMYLYCYAVKQLLGEFPTTICWNHFADEGKLMKIPFNQKEYEETVQWFIDTIHKIENEKEFEPNRDYFYCHNLCNFRNSCEYAKTPLEDKV